MATVIKGQSRIAPKHFGLYRTRVGGDESIIVRRKIGEPADVMHSASMPVKDQRRRFKIASQHYASLTPVQKAESKLQVRFIDRVSSTGDSEEVLLMGRQLFISEDIALQRTEGTVLVPPRNICIVATNENFEPMPANLRLNFLARGEWYEAKYSKLTPLSEEYWERRNAIYDDFLAKRKALYDEYRAQGKPFDDVYWADWEALYDEYQWKIELLDKEWEIREAGSDFLFQVVPFHMKYVDLTKYKKAERAPWPVLPRGEQYYITGWATNYANSPLPLDTVHYFFMLPKIHYHPLVPTWWHNVYGTCGSTYMHWTPIELPPVDVTWAALLWDVKTGEFSTNVIVEWHYRGVTPPDPWKECGGFYVPATGNEVERVRAPLLGLRPEANRKYEVRFSFYPSQLNAIQFAGLIAFNQPDYGKPEWWNKVYGR